MRLQSGEMSTLPAPALHRFSYKEFWILSSPWFVLFKNLSVQRIQCRTGLEPTDLLRGHAVVRFDIDFLTVRFVNNNVNRLTRGEAVQSQDTDPIRLLEKIPVFRV